MGKHTTKLMEYKDQYPFLTEEDYIRYYDYAAETPLSVRPIDLN